MKEYILDGYTPEYKPFIDLVLLFGTVLLLSKVTHKKSPEQ